MLRMFFGMLRMIPGMLRMLSGMLRMFSGMLRMIPGMLRMIPGMLRMIPGMLHMISEPGPSAAGPSDLTQDEEADVEYDPVMAAASFANYRAPGECKPIVIN